MAKITKETTVEEAIEKYPQLVDIFMKFRVRCLVCGEAPWGTIEEEAKRNNVKDIDQLVEALNRAIDETQN